MKYLLKSSKILLEKFGSSTRDFEVSIHTYVDFRKILIINNFSENREPFYVVPYGHFGLTVDGLIILVWVNNVEHFPHLLYKGETGSYWQVLCYWSETSQHAGKKVYPFKNKNKITSFSEMCNNLFIEWKP